jgi:hypothetical protein
MSLVRVVRQPDVPLATIMPNIRLDGFHDFWEVEAHVCHLQVGNFADHMRIVTDRLSPDSPGNNHSDRLCPELSGKCGHVSCLEQ